MSYLSETINSEHVVEKIKNYKREYYKKYYESNKEKILTRVKKNEPAFKKQKYETTEERVTAFKVRQTEAKRKYYIKNKKEIARKNLLKKTNKQEVIEKLKEQISILEKN